MQNIPQEIETKIIRRVPKTLGDFESLMKKVGATIHIPRRLLSDRRYRLKNSRPVSTAVPVSVFMDEGRGHATLEFLGLTVIGIQNNIVSLTAEILPRRVVRLRHDGTKIIWTVKEMIIADNGRSRGQVKQRGEVEVELLTFQPIEKLLKEIGYQCVSEREKFRTTYSLETTLIEWQESPSPLVTPWMEVEGPSIAAVKEIIARLGFAERDMAAISDAEYLYRSGVPNKQIRRLVFSH
ncbi:MAG: hypothetical protein EXS55_02860 [Candidatus Magasanikbacteria bacterium]|nr:hypothetical protein [Candidatus Magasanikbacteria bacterium]